MRRRSILLLLAVLVALSEQKECYKDQYPRQYIAHRAQEPIVIDGKLDDKDWTLAKWSDDFVDIVTTASPPLRTRAKVIWDSEYLYIAAELEETHIWSNISETCHCINATQDQIIYHDNDFEVFVDPDGSTHYYKEFEVNALAATWDLCLNKAYMDGGYENSSRVFGSAGFDMPRQRVATSIDGAINDPSKPSRRWFAEVALPLSSLVYNTTASYPPKSGSFWRINFSRVEWTVAVIGGKFVKTPSCMTCSPKGAPAEDNWVWQKMTAVNMHQPNEWGMLQFAEDPSSQPVFNRQWPVRYVAAAMYSGLHRYASEHGAFTSDVSALEKYLPPSLFECTQTPSISLVSGGFDVTVRDDEFIATIRDDRYLQVLPVHSLE